MYEWKDMPLCIYKCSLQKVLYLLYRLYIESVELGKQRLKDNYISLASRQK